MTEFRFKAFISYSHQNSDDSSWLMKKLEAYRVPVHVNGSRATFANSPKSLGKIFRDREELPASDSLNAKLLDAIKQSEFLIVICSPAAAKSDRVAEEIRQFIKHRDSRKILCFVVEGEPQFGAVARPIGQDCVSPALRKLYLQSGQIPVAADARVVGDGSKRALQKLIAGLLEVDLDELVRRDERRHQKRLVLVAAVSVAFALFTTGLLVHASLAESAAHQASLDAQLQNARAEDLIHFMVEDLVGIKLQQLGRLDVVDAVASKVAAYYAQQDDDTLMPLGLARKAQAYMKLGWLYLGRNMHESADELFEYAHRTTATLVTRYPDSEEAIFAHIRSLYSIGLSNIFRGQYAAAERAWRERTAYGEILLRNDDHSETVWSNLGDIYVHLGWSLMELGRVEEAYIEFKKGLALRRQNADRFSDDNDWLNSLAGGHYHVQWAELYLGKNELALANAVVSNETYKKLADADPTDQRALGNYGRSLRWYAEARIANQQYLKAEQHLRKSVEVHQDLLDFEPNETTFQYQTCVSSVMLLEVLIAGGKHKDARLTSEVMCSNGPEVLALDHPVTHNRIYGYRYKLVQIRLALLEGHNDDAAALYSAVSSQFAQENSEVRNSLLGNRITLSLAIDAVELNNRLHDMPNAPQHLTTIVKKMESGSAKLHSPTARLIVKAKKLLALAVD